MKETPTYAKERLRIILSLMSNNIWCLNAISIKILFLKGEQIERNIFVEPQKKCGY